MCGIPLIPNSFAKLGLYNAVYRQGAGTCLFGWSHRPCFFAQDKMAGLIRSEFLLMFDQKSYGWWPYGGSLQEEKCNR